MPRMLINNSAFFAIICFFTSCSFTGKIDSGKLSGMCFYSSFAHQTLFFHESTVKIKKWDGYPTASYTTLISEQSLPYSYDGESQTGTIDGVSFKLSISKSNKPIYSIWYMDYPHNLEKVLSKDPAAPYIIVIGLLGITLLAGSFIYKKYKSK